MYLVHCEGFAQHRSGEGKERKCDACCAGAIKNVRFNVTKWFVDQTHPWLNPETLTLIAILVVDQ